MAGTYEEEIRLREENEEALIKKSLDDLRDRMATAAMNGFLSQRKRHLEDGVYGFVFGTSFGQKKSRICELLQLLARASYNIADAMLEARQRTQEDPSESPQP